MRSIRGPRFGSSTFAYWVSRSPTLQLGWVVARQSEYATWVRGIRSLGPTSIASEPVGAL